MNQIKVITILVKDRIKEAGRTQKLLTKFGHIIKNRLGSHEVSENVCSRIGVIILQLAGNPDEWTIFEKKLSEIGGIEFKTSAFNL
jgi:hypothetical protein